jgi:hypothetical protein
VLRPTDGHVSIAKIVDAWYAANPRQCAACQLTIREAYSTRGTRMFHPSCATHYDAQHAVAHGAGIPAHRRARLAAAVADTHCADCRRRVAPDDRIVRRIGAEHFVFHRACVEAGTLRKRIATAGLRTPAALQRRQAARAALNRAKR